MHPKQNQKSTREFLRKWGEWIQNDSYQYPIINPKYNKGLVIENCNDQFIEMLEPWGDNLYVDCSYEEYIEKESKRTVMDLHDRIKPYDNEKQNPILVEIDGSNFNQQDMIYIQKIAEILDTQTILDEFNYLVSMNDINNWIKEF